MSLSVMDNSGYTYKTVWSEEDQEYVGLCEQFPGLSWLSESQEKALAGIRRLVDECVLDMSEGDEPVPLGKKDD